MGNVCQHWTYLNAVFGQFMGVGSAYNTITFNAREGNLYGNVFVGQTHNQTVFGSVVFVLVLEDQAFAGIVIGFTLTTPAELNLITLEVLLILDYFNETLGKRKTFINIKIWSKKSVKYLILRKFISNCWVRSDFRRHFVMVIKILRLLRTIQKIIRINHKILLLMPLLWWWAHILFLSHWQNAHFFFIPFPVQNMNIIKLSRRN